MDLNREKGGRWVVELEVEGKPLPLDHDEELPPTGVGRSGKGASAAAGVGPPATVHSVRRVIFWIMCGYRVPPRKGKPYLINFNVVGNTACTRFYTGV